MATLDNKRRTTLARWDHFLTAASEIGEAAVIVLVPLVLAAYAFWGE